MLLSQKEIKHIQVRTPAGIVYEPDIAYADFNEKEACCMVRKDSGDDPDITNGMLIGARVYFPEDKGSRELKIKAGEGIGTVRKRGLSVPVGEPAINPVPRSMILKEVSKACDLYGYEGGLIIEISAKGGEEIAKKTFNPRMGVEGGISIIGTSGIVETMSSKAIIDTIKLDLSIRKAAGEETVIMVPGNYGADFLKNNYGVIDERPVMFSNFVGEACDLIREMGFLKVLFCCHIGKLIKVSGGIMNTHSRYADCRMELMLAAFMTAYHKSGKDLDIRDISGNILGCISTTAALNEIEKTGLLKETSDIILKKAVCNLRRRVGEDIRTECILYENSYGLLSRSEGALELL